MFAVVLAAVSFFSPAPAGHPVSGTNANNGYDRDRALQISQAAIGNTVGNHAFTDTQGRPRRLHEYRGQPLVISLIYTSCFHICPTTTQHLDRVADKARAVLGEDSFHVISVGFDARHDTADAMRVFARQQGVQQKGWDFLSADQTTVDALSDELGFLFFVSPNGFDHLVQTSVIDAEGRVYRQVYGVNFPTPQLVEPLKELVFGEPRAAEAMSVWERISNKIRLFCTVYDPASDRYRFDYSIFMGLIVGLAVGALFIYWIVREWRRRLRREASERQRQTSRSGRSI